MHIYRIKPQKLEHVIEHVVGLAQDTHRKLVFFEFNFSTEAECLDCERKHDLATRRYRRYRELLDQLIFMNHYLHAHRLI